MRFLTTILMLLAGAAHADETWTCTETSSYRSNNAWVMCGVAEGMSEGWARTKALDYAVREFKELCKLDSGCNRHEFHVEPKRVTCETKDGSWYKCYRMLQITVE